VKQPLHQLRRRIHPKRKRRQYRTSTLTSNSRHLGLQHIMIACCSTTTCSHTLRRGTKINARDLASMHKYKLSLSSPLHPLLWPQVKFLPEDNLVIGPIEIPCQGVLLLTLEPSASNGSCTRIKIGILLEDSNEIVPNKNHCFDLSGLYPCSSRFILRVKTR